MQNKMVFNNNPKNAKTKAVAYSIMKTAEVSYINPYKYLCNIFTYTPDKDITANTILDIFIP